MPAPPPLPPSQQTHVYYHPAAGPSAAFPQSYVCYGPPPPPPPPPSSSQHASACYGPPMPPSQPPSACYVPSPSQPPSACYGPPLPAPPPPSCAYSSLVSTRNSREKNNPISLVKSQSTKGTCYPNQHRAIIISNDSTRTTTIHPTIIEQRLHQQHRTRPVADHRHPTRMDAAPRSPQYPHHAQPVLTIRIRRFTRPIPILPNEASCVEL